MRIYYFRDYRLPGPPMDVLCSFDGTLEELREFLGGHAPGLTFAVFDETTTPPTLKYRAKGVRMTFAGARKQWDKFPDFFIDADGSIWASEQMDDWGKVGKVPIMPGSEWKPYNPHFKQS